MAALKYLENRITELENKIYGSNTERDVVTQFSILESIIRANTMISSALTGRKNINALVKRLPELDIPMQENSDECDLKVDAKLKVLLALEWEIKENLESVKKIQSLMPVLETDKFKNIPKMSQKLNQLTLSYLKADEESELLNKDVHEMYTKYNAILLSISEVLSNLDTSITSLEVSSMKKK